MGQSVGQLVRPSIGPSVGLFSIGPSVCQLIDKAPNFHTWVLMTYKGNLIILKVTYNGQPSHPGSSAFNKTWHPLLR